LPSSGPPPGPGRPPGMVPASALAGVAAGQGVPADDEHVGKHLHAVAQHADFGAGGVCPAHRDFGGPQTVMASEVEEFGVEAETLDALLFENDFTALAFEGFEATLRVDEGKEKVQA